MGEQVVPYKDRDLHREQIRTDNRRWDATHREQRRLRAIEYRRTHPAARASVDRWQAQHHEKLLAAYSAHSKANPDKMREKNAIRRARKAGATVERVYCSVVFKRDNGLCGECGTSVDPANWHLDHIRPLSAKGDHSYANTQVTHPLCNLRKGARVEQAA